jgi:hypothetical protein
LNFGGAVSGNRAKEGVSVVKNVIKALLDEVEQFEGRAGIESIARDGYQGELTEECQTALLAEYGEPGDVLYAIQRRAQSRCNLYRLDAEHVTGKQS